MLSVQLDKMTDRQINPQGNLSHLSGGSFGEDEPKRHKRRESIAVNQETWQMFTSPSWRSQVFVLKFVDNDEGSQLDVGFVDDRSQLDPLCLILCSLESFNEVNMATSMTNSQKEYRLNWLDMDVHDKR